MIFEYKLIPIVSAVINLAVIFYRLFWIGNIKKKLGSCVLILPRKKNVSVFAICALSFFLLFFLFFRTFQLFVTVIFSLCSIFAVELSVRDALLHTINGEYKNGSVIDGKLELADS